MEHFIWKQSFAIGIDEIDEQHKMFLDYVNECQIASSRNSSSQVTAATIWDPRRTRQYTSGTKKS